MISVINSLEVIQESIPWRSGKIKLAVGKTTIKGDNYDCFLLNDLKFFLKLNPTFAFCVPSGDPSIKKPFGIIENKGESANGYIIAAQEAQNLGYSKKYLGTCKAKTYFFGRKQEGRTLDLYFRLFERGFSIENIQGIDLFDGTEKYEISCSKDQFSHSSMILGKRKVSPFFQDKGTIELTGKNIHLIPARIVRRK